jgi:hypothetical protein
MKGRVNMMRKNHGNMTATTAEVVTGRFLRLSGRVLHARSGI